MKHRTFSESLKDAFKGLFFAMRHERNMGYHILAAGIVLVVSFHFHLDRIELLFVCTAIFLVIITEMINTAVEAVVDLYTSEYHHLAKVAKRVAAGAVLCAALFSLVVAYLVFADKLW
ncbi:MAG TPA: diacylglycerol kinase family protein [Firmicutes bacterium]|jgi:diacylglycerol kinase (ATP)|nr:diacylglycerol kinase family protein [Bacillota bacterium]